MKAELRYLERRSIEDEKWNRCISASANGLVYAQSWYLDAMANQWGALVLDDYAAVMPIPWNTKYGIRYCYQPFLCAQLGVFGNELSESMVNEFTQEIPSSVRLVELSMNSGNFHPARTTRRSNYELPLQPSYEDLVQAYRENTRRNIKKAFQLGCRMDTHFDVEEIISLAWEQMNAHDRNAKHNLDQFRKLYSTLSEKNAALTYGVRNMQNELIASALFIVWQNRAYYILVGNHPNGRTIGASHALIDGFIKDHAGKDLLLDFEGSDLRNLAFFYSGFGAQLETYPFLKINRLPFYLKWMKS